ncbi:MAG: IMP cyclohydrolase [Fibrobacter sp.]|nr:IMP cyclohydrolase [Fibrobacter sp.]
MLIFWLCKKSEVLFMYQAAARQNFENLSHNSYPGRGIVQGVSPCGNHFVQVYWIMGRSENSRNRIFIQDANTGFVRTQAFDESKLTDPSLIIYHPARHLDGVHIITNGDQTDTIYEALLKGKTFESALETRAYEPDAPNFTPRISGIFYKNPMPAYYKLSILKSAGNAETAGCERFTYAFERPLPGLGHFISTYAHDGSPIPSFTGEPQWMPLAGTPEKTLEMYWDALNAENKVSLMVKWIDRKTFESRVLIRNKLG